jgi:O-methyltransferase involved in polyketide biosynthesis
LEIASLFPESAVFDVDLHNMPEKQRLVGGRAPNVEFCECDIADIERLDGALAGAGFRKEAPTIAVLEGILYYLTPDALGNILRYLADNRAAVVGEFGLKPELVDETTRVHLLSAFAKIQSEVNLDFVTFYSDDSITALLRDAGFGSITLHNFQLIQKERTGDEAPFTARGSSWIRSFCAS